MSRDEGQCGDAHPPPDPGQDGRSNEAERRWGADGEKRGWGTNLEKQSGAAKGLGRRDRKAKGVEKHSSPFSLLPGVDPDLLFSELRAEEQEEVTSTQMPKQAGAEFTVSPLVSMMATESGLLSPFHRQTTEAGVAHICIEP